MIVSGGGLFWIVVSRGRFALSGGFILSSGGW